MQFIINILICINFNIHYKLYIVPFYMADICILNHVNYILLKMYMNSYTPASLYKDAV